MHLPLARFFFLMSNSLLIVLVQVKFWSAPVAASCQCNGTCMSRDGPRDRIGVKKGSRFSADLRRGGHATAVAPMSAVRRGSVIETTGAEASHQQQQQPEHEFYTATIVSLPSIAASANIDPLTSSTFRRVSAINDFELQNLCDNVFTQTADPHGSRDAGFAPVSAFAAMLCVCPPFPSRMCLTVNAQVRDHACPVKGQNAAESRQESVMAECHTFYSQAHVHACSMLREGFSGQLDPQALWNGTRDGLGAVYGGHMARLRLCVMPLVRTSETAAAAIG